VDPVCADYFKRRKMHPTQEIREEKPDGSVTVAYRIGHYEAIRSMLKSWIPHIRIIEPEAFREDFLAEIADWVARET
jgi:predicted DNA-binding transcriptional regulator YafY